jgi:hypothetical protein
MKLNKPMACKRSNAHRVQGTIQSKDPAPLLRHAQDNSDGTGPGRSQGVESLPLLLGRLELRPE